MAKQYRPVRALLGLGVVVAVLAVITAWPGTRHTPNLGLDLRGGTQVILSPKTLSGSVTADQLAQTVGIIRARVDGFGVAESEVTTQGSGANAKIIVSIPGETSRTVVDQLKTTAALNFRPVVTYDYGSPQAAASAAPSASAVASPTGAPATSASALPSATPVTTPSAAQSVAPEKLTPPIQDASLSQDLAARFSALDCATSTVMEGGSLDDPEKYLVTCSKDGSLKYVLGPASVRGTDISDAQAGLPQTGAGAWEVTLQFTTGGAKKFADVTTELATKQSPENQFGIVLDGLVMSAPQVNEAILGGNALITGNFSAQEAKDLAQILKFGALPVSLSVDEVQQISANLGNDQLRAGVLAGLFGLLLTVLYLLVYYRALGFIAVVSLIVAAATVFVLVVSLSRYIGFTMTLAGVAGAIVAIGITADSFIVFFERIRDEIREGRRLAPAIDHGWERARRTILAADFVSLLAAVVLYYLSVGSVRGFAFTLGLTTAIDVAVAFFFTHPVVRLLANNRWFNAGSAMTGVSPERLGVVKEIA